MHRSHSTFFNTVKTLHIKRKEESLTTLCQNTSHKDYDNTAHFVQHTSPGVILCGWLGSKHQLTNCRTHHSLSGSLHVSVTLHHVWILNQRDYSLKTVFVCIIAGYFLAHANSPFLFLHRRKTDRVTLAQCSKHRLWASYRLRLS